MSLRKRAIRVLKMDLLIVYLVDELEELIEESGVDQFR